MAVILQRIPSNVNLDEIKSYLNNNPKINSFSDIHIWSLDGEYNVMTININLQPNAKPEIISDIHTDLARYNIQHCTIELC